MTNGKTNGGEVSLGGIMEQIRNDIATSTNEGLRRWAWEIQANVNRTGDGNYQDHPTWQLIQSELQRRGHR